MKKIITLLVALMPVLGWAQSSQIPNRTEIITVSGGDEEFPSDVLEVFYVQEEGQNHYYLSVGHLGLGDEVVQIMVDPLFELFIPLGDTLTEALETLQTLQAQYKEKPGTSREVSGCLAFGFPNDQLEKVTVTTRKALFSRMLEFSVERDGYIRATTVGKSDFGSLVGGVKFHLMIHPE